MIPTRFLFPACLFLALFALPSVAKADHWQKSTDGYWYYWSDDDQRWFWLDGKDWWVENENGKWVQWTPRAVAVRRAYYPPVGGSVSFPYGSVSWGAGGQVIFPYGSVSWGPGGGHVSFPFGTVTWPGRGWQR